MNTAGRIGTDHRLRTDKFDLGQFGGSCKQGFCRDSEAGSDDASEVVALCCDGAKGRGGAEIDDDEIASILMMRSCCVHQSVAADFFWVVVTESKSRVRIRGDDHRVVVKILFEHIFDGSGQCRYNTGDDGAGETLRGNPCGCQETGKKNAVLVGGFFCVRGDSPMSRQGSIIIDAPDNVGIADIDDEKHDAYCTFWLGDLASGQSGLSGLFRLSG